MLREQEELLPIVGKNPKGGRPSKSDAEAKISERIGVPRQTINLARQHVKAAEKYPVLKKAATQKEALTVAKNLDALPIMIASNSKTGGPVKARPVVVS